VIPLGVALPAATVTAFLVGAAGAALLSGHRGAHPTQPVTPPAAASAPAALPSR
jgi:hypothetical protein